MEAVVANDLWIWHSFVGPPGSNNDINIVDKSPLVTSWLQGAARTFSFSVGNREYVYLGQFNARYIVSF